MPALTVSAPAVAVDPPAKKASVSRRRKWTVAFLAAIPVVALAGVVGYLRSRPQAPAFRTVRVAAADIIQRVTATGTLQSVVTWSRRWSAAGGLIGLVRGIGGSLASVMGWPFVVTPFWTAIAFGISMAIGVIFGFCPARKAAQMNPIDALRFE